LATPVFVAPSTIVLTAEAGKIYLLATQSLT
jgi:hypothetical protein